jgi:uncharacterized protein YegL
MSSPFAVETPKNYEQKCLCVLVLDTSGSMQGAPIDALNQALRDFRTEVEEDFNASNRLEIGIVTFSDVVEVAQEPTLVEGMIGHELKAAGLTYLVDGVRTAINMIKTRKSYYQETGQKYYRPWIVLFTDGSPDRGQDIDGLAAEIKDGVDRKNYMFYPIGVEGADMEILSKIAHPSSPPMKLQGLKFVEFFKWLSNSMAIITSSKEGQTVQLPSPNSWSQISI